MRWAFVTDEMIKRNLADTALVNLLGGNHIYRNRDRDTSQVPGIYWIVTSDVERESTEEITMQWDVWGHNTEMVQQLEARLRANMNLSKEQPLEINGVRLHMWFEHGFPLHTNEPGTMARGLAFRYIVEGQYE